MRDRSQRRRLAGAALAAGLALACAEAVSPGEELCAEILALEIPGAEPLEAWPGVAGVAVDYRVPDEDAAVAHRIECLIAEPDPPGSRLRAASVRIDGHELSEAELLLVDSELLLAEMRRADPAAPRAPSLEATAERLREGSRWIEATLSRLTREALAAVDAWWRQSQEAARERGGAAARV